MIQMASVARGQDQAKVIRLAWISQQFKAAFYNPGTATRATDVIRLRPHFGARALIGQLADLAVNAHPPLNWFMCTSCLNLRICGS
jgi:hypothetical protein